MKSNFKFILFFLIVVSCKQVQKVTDVITNPSAREVFERTFKDNDSILQQYEFNYSKAKRNNLQLELPSVLSSKTDSLNFRILAYTLHLERGERFIIESDVEVDSLQLSLDLFAFDNDSTLSKKPLVANEPEVNALKYDITETGNYKIVILPERSNNRNFSLSLYTEPTLFFPVSGKDNKAIQSFWGASRGGGTRAHKGIDIFAKRGTPVVAATDGFISDTGNRGLGGKQVWLRDGIFGQSLYYAHLDSIAVSGGNRVKAGDTLGFVGNTGNAKTTSPHLHFGIYTSSGAINPLPFVKETNKLEVKKNTVFSKGETRLKTNELRVGAGVKNKKIQDLKPKVSVTVLGKKDKWLHSKVNDSLEGFMHQSLVSKIN